MSRSNGKNGDGQGGPASRPATAIPGELRLRFANQTDAVPLGFFFDAILRRDYFMRRGQLEDMLASPYHRVLIAEIDSILVGVAVTTRGTRLVNVLVHPAYRGLGIGRALVSGSGATEVRIKLDMSSGNPRGFYQSLGFRTTGRPNGKGNIARMCLPKRHVAGASPRSA